MEIPPGGILIFACSTGNQAIEMLKFIESASKDEESDAIDAEKTAQGKFEGEMQVLRIAIRRFLESESSLARGNPFIETKEL